MKDSVQRRAWSDIRRGVFTPEPLTDVDEYWVEVTEDSELMCDVCKGFHQNDSRMSTCTENRTKMSELRKQLDEIGNLRN